MMLLFLVLLYLFSSCTAHVTNMDRPLRPCDPTNPSFFSYHIHILFWQTNANSTAAALALRDSFAKEFNVQQHCPIEAGDPAPEQHTICYFNPDMEPAGPFLTAQWSFFIPKVTPYPNPNANPNPNPNPRASTASLRRWSIL